MDLRKVSAIRLLAVFALILLVAIGGLFLHEAGHGLAALLLGGRITLLRVMPGIQLFPKIALVPWKGNVAAIGIDLPAGTTRQYAFVALMGSSLTFLLGLAAGLSLLLFKPTGWLRVLFVITALALPLDMITYSIFPVLGLRHWILFGGKKPEPLMGAVGLGVPPAVYYTVLALVSVVYYVELARRWNYSQSLDVQT
jgi:hypothetical protein